MRRKKKKKKRKKEEEEEKEEGKEEERRKIRKSYINPISTLTTSECKRAKRNDTIQMCLHCTAPWTKLSKNFQT